jgi:hypothetical protein
MMKYVAIPLTAAGGLVMSATPAAAAHVHFRVLGNGQCVLIAPDGGEKYVELPHAGPGPRHPLHVNVHLGEPGDPREPGEHGRIFVAYDAQGNLTAVAADLCGGEFVNR